MGRTRKNVRVFGVRVNRRRITVLAAVVMLLSLLFLASSVFAASDSSATIKFGSKVRVISGFYEGCTGIVIDKFQDDYTVEANCKDSDNKDRFVILSAKENELIVMWPVRHCKKGFCLTDKNGGPKK